MITPSSVADSKGAADSEADKETETEDTTTPPIPSSIRSSVSKLPLLSVRAGPRDGDGWLARLKQELQTLIQYQTRNKAADQDWFIIQPVDTLGIKSSIHATYRTQPRW